MRPVKTVSSVLDLGKGRLEKCLGEAAAREEERKSRD